jgi:hypothetical protein
VEGELTIYPNPTRANLLVELPKDMTMASYRVLDMTGRVLFEGSRSKDQPILELELAGIRPGMYIFEAFDTQRIVHKRFIKL